MHFQDVQDFVVREFEQHLDKSLLTKAGMELGNLGEGKVHRSQAVWDATMLTFKDKDIQPKAGADQAEL